MDVTATTVTAEQIFERTVIAALLQSTEIFNKIFNILKAEYFTETRSSLFELITQHYQQYQTPCSWGDLQVSIKNKQNQEFKQSLIQELQACQAQPIPDVAVMTTETLKFVKDALYLQALRIGSEGLMQHSDELKLKAERILDERAKVNIDSDVGIEFKDLRILDYYSHELQGIKTQHFALNKRLGPGFLPGTLSVILAASGVGKSLLMTDLISGMLKTGKRILLVSLEMAQEEVMKRVHANVLGMPIEDFLPGRFKPEIFKTNLQRAQAAGCGLFYAKDYPAQSFSSLQLEALVETFKNEKNIEFDIIFVDYLGIMKSDLQSHNVGLYSYVKSIAEELRATATKLQVPIISASQLNRSATNATDSDNAAVSDSYGTVMTADFMMFLLQTEDMKQNGDIIAKITKNRFSGITDSFNLKVDYTLMRFIDPEAPSTEAFDTGLDDLGPSGLNFNQAPKGPSAQDYQDCQTQYKYIQHQDQQLAQKIDQQQSQNQVDLNELLDQIIKK